jgi:hypothetical protein
MFRPQLLSEPGNPGFIRFVKLTARADDAH